VFIVMITQARVII